MSENQTTQAPDQGASAPAETVPNLLAEQCFRLVYRDPQTNQINSPLFSMKSRCLRIACDLSRDGSGMWVSIMLPRLKYSSMCDSIARAAKEGAAWSESYNREEERDGVKSGIKLTIGINAEGIVYMSMSNNQGAEKTYEFIDDNYVYLADMSGNPLPKSEASRRFARRFSADFKITLDHLWHTGKDTDAGPAQRRPNNQGGNNFRGGQGGNNYRGGQGGNNFRGGQGGNNFRGGQGGNNYRGGQGGNFKKQWNGGGQGGGYRNNGYQQNQGYQQQPQQPQQQQAPATEYNFDDYNIG